MTIKRTLVQDMEERVATMTIKELLKAGFAIGLENEDGPKIKRAKSLKKLLGAMFDYRYDILYVYRMTEKEPWGWIKFVYGNEGYDVLSDYTTNLEKVLKPINAFTDQYF